jgi:two-component system nitrogen regulation response regulator NtrX
VTLVLVVDDVPAMAESYAYDLKRVGGYDTLIAMGGDKALDIISSEPVDCVILDLEMPGTDGFAVLSKLRERGLETPVIVYTGTGNYDRCVQAVQLGAYSFIDKSEPVERLVQEVENALERVRLLAEVESLKRDLGTASPLIGSSPAMAKLNNEIVRIAPIPSHVLVVGETGSGKELVARELHRLGRDPKKPFVAINSAALPENLVESELFGHERGAFTGASRAHKGAFEMAAGGTLFLDEIGELPVPAQAKLLRVLEENQVTRVGGERYIKVDARVVAATNRNLEEELEAGNFRRDLFYRLAVHVIQVPPLRQRVSDLPELIDHFLKMTCSRFGVRKKKLDPAALELLMAGEWKRNNVRELRNIVERMIIATGDDVIRAEHVPAEIRETAGPGKRPSEAQTFQELKAEAERQIILSALERNDWHITNTARALGLADHASLLKIMRRHRIRRD